MKIKLKNLPNISLGDGSSGTGNISQNAKENCESLFITGCPGINGFAVFKSILDTTGNKLSRIRIEGGTQTIFFSDIQNIIDSGIKGFNNSGEETDKPAILGKFILPGMHRGEYDLEATKNRFEEGLSIEVEKYCETFEDNIVEKIVAEKWGFKYDKNKWGIDAERIKEINDIENSFYESNITKFLELRNFTGISTIPSQAFYQNQNLEEISLPDRITSVGNKAFYGCINLKKLIYPKNVTIIGNENISGCTNLEYIHILSNEVVTITPDSFINSNCDIYIGNGSSPYHDNTLLERYLNNDDWKIYKTRLKTWYSHEIENILPDEYQLVNYIQSDGENVINTGLQFTNNTKFIADISLVQGEDVVYGSAQSGLKSENGNLIFSLSNHTETLIEDYKFDDIERLYSFDIKNNIIELNGEIIYSGEDGTSLGGSIKLFGCSDSQFSGKTWLTQVYESDTLIANFIPCYRKEDYLVGLYDTVRDSFFGFNTYVCEGVNRGIITEDEKNNLITERDSYFFNLKSPNNIKNDLKLSSLDISDLNNCETVGFINNYELPLEYIPVDYITCTGEQYIQTDIVPEDDNWQIEYKASLSTNADSLSIPFGVGPMSSVIRTGEGPEGIIDYYYCGDSKTYSKQLTLEHTSSVGFNGYKFDGIVLDNPTKTTSLIGNTNPIYLLAYSQYIPSGNYFYNGNIFYFKIWHNNELVGHFIPCYRKEDKKLGLYDTVGNQFYINGGNKSDFSGYGQVLPYESKKYKIGDLEEKYNISTNSCGINDFSSLVSYEEGDFVYKNTCAYKFITTHAPGQWNESEVVKINAIDELSELQNIDNKEEVNIYVRSTDGLLDVENIKIHISNNGIEKDIYTDAEGKVGLIIIKGNSYTVLAENKDGYNPPPLFTLDSNKSKEDLVITYSKTTAPISCEITINFTVEGGSVSILEDKQITAFYSNKKDYLLVPIKSGKAVLQSFQGLEGIIYFQAITGYTTPDKINFTASGPSMSINVTYKI